MQKVLQRTKRAETRFSKERQRFDSLRENQKRTANRREQQEITRYRNETYKTARNQRKEDWALGPLAPKRKVGPGADEYGAMSKEQFRGAALWEDKRIKYWPIIEDDRVVIVEPGHQDRGKIGKVISIDKDQNTLKVEALNMVRAIKIYDHSSC